MYACIMIKYTAIGGLWGWLNSSSSDHVWRHRPDNPAAGGVGARRDHAGVVDDADYFCRRRAHYTQGTVACGSRRVATTVDAHFTGPPRTRRWAANACCAQSLHRSNRPQE